jgi:signal transduction histidine kinase
VETRPIRSQPATSSFAVAVPVPAQRPALTRYAVAVGAVFLALAVTMPFASFLERVILVLFWPAVIGSAWFGGIGPAILASALSVFVADYYLIGVPGQLTPASPDDLIPLTVFLFASSAVALLTDTARSAQRTAAQAAAQNAELAHEIELQAIELEHQLEESQALSEELEQSTEELAERTAAAEAAFEAKRVALERTERLQRMTAALADATSEREIAHILVTNLREVLEPIAVVMYRVEPGADGTSELVMADESGVTPANRLRFARVHADGDLPIAELVRQREPAFLSDGAAFRARFPDWADRRLAGKEAWIGLPLIASTGSPLGAFALGFADVRAFDVDLRRYVESFADQATQAFERVRLLEAEHAARQAAEEANRAKTQFLATMSHELRTPLNAISGYAELLSLGLRGPTTPEQQEDLSRIMRSQRHLLSVINDILNFARLEAGHVEYRVAEVPASQLVSDLEALIRPQLAAKQLEFSCASVSDGIAVRADGEKVRQVLLNLLANAIKFTSPGGRVHVDCTHDESRVYISVGDTGIGIPTDRRSAIFEPFVQLHRTLAQPAEGTGLGLAISRDLARGMGGELTVESEPGAGSTFTLSLPRVQH